MKNKLGIAGLTIAAAVVVASQTGAAQAAVSYFSTTTTVTGYGTASCAAGAKITGGGFETIPVNVYTSTYSDEYTITGSSAASATSWTATGTKVHGVYYPNSGWKYTTGSFMPTAVAVCAQ